MFQTADVAIIGGGIIGCSIAYSLRKAGVDVVVLERGEIGAQASGAAAGLVAPLGPITGPGPFADLLLAGFAHIPTLVSELEEISGIPVNYVPTGSLRLIRETRRISHLRKRFETWKRLGLDVRWLERADLRRLEPQLAPEVCAAVYTPTEAQIDPISIVQAFAQAACTLGAHIQPHQAVVGLQTDQESVQAILLGDGTTLHCKTLVIASGAWTNACLQWLNCSLPVTPLHGQLLAFAQCTPPLRHILFGDAAYLVPRGQQIIVGATREETGFTVQVTDSGISWLTTTSGRLIPSLARSRITHTWAGLRPYTPDHRPILGSLPGWKNVIVAVGHNSVGIILSSITGQAIAELITTGVTPEIIRPFSARRF